MHFEKEVGLSSFRNDWQRASLNLLFTHGFVLNSHEAFFKPFELTAQQYNILRILKEQFPKPVSTSVLRERMLDKMSDASRLVSRLHTKGLVEVTRNSLDKRLVNILISAKGQILLSKIDGELHKLDSLLQGLTEAEVLQLNELLDKVRNSIKTVNERISTPEELVKSA
jgi:MarR family transcriptional regulator, 2-MHQ and catechol-resistance regulon repressor